MTSNQTIQIRRATIADLDRMLSCYEGARCFMRAMGNHSQWTDGYPSRELIMEDIRMGVSYIGEDEEGKMAMVFAFIIGADPTYTIIEDGAWPNAQPYGTIHRLASTGTHRGMLKACIDFTLRYIDNVRLDTHADNAPMQRAISRIGFSKCGIIRCSDGTPRIAYHLTSKK